MLRLLILAAVLLAVGPASAQKFQADSGISVKSTIIANNTTAVAISNTAATVYMIDAFNNNTTLAYIKLYNAPAASVTCGQTTLLPQWRGMIPFGTSASGGGFGLPNINGDAYVNGVAMCVTTGIADNDTGAPAGNTYIVNVHYKPGQP